MDLPLSTQQRSFFGFAGALDPTDRLGEFLCGLIMVLSILLTAGYYVVGSDNPARSLLIAAIGCNVAWGIIDGFFNIGYTLVDRSAKARLIENVNQAGNKPAAEDAIREQVEGDLFDALDEQEQQRAVDLLYNSLRDEPIEETQIHREDWGILFASILLNFLATVPATLPFIFISDWKVALRVSNLVCVIMLFLLGYRFGQNLHANPLKIGGGLMLFGLAMVGIAVALGG